MAQADQKNSLVVFFLVAGLVLFALAFWIGKRTSTAPQQSILAHVLRETGQSTIIRAGYTKKELVDRKMPLSNLDSVETNETGEAILEFQTGDRIRIFENSLITIEQNENETSGSLVVVLKKGDLKIETQGRDKLLLIAKNGKRIAAADFENSSLQGAPLQISTASNEAPAKTNSQLSDEEISSTLLSHKASLDKCYIKLLQKDPQAKGQVSLSFSIENSGKIAMTEFNSAQFKDEDFKKCLLDLVQRISFRPFSGPAVSTVFPIQFE